jgi:hypothetical protein
VAWRGQGVPARAVRVAAGLTRDAWGGAGQLAGEENRRRWLNDGEGAVPLFPSEGRKKKGGRPVL